MHDNKVVEKMEGICKNEVEFCDEFTNNRVVRSSTKTIILKKKNYWVILNIRLFYVIDKYFLF